MLAGGHKCISEEKEPALEVSAEEARLPAVVTHSSVNRKVHGLEVLS